VCIHVACVCVTVYWASQLIPFISGVDSDSDCVADDEDRYDYWGYGSDFEESADEYE